MAVKYSDESVVVTLGDDSTSDTTTGGSWVYGSSPVESCTEKLEEFQGHMEEVEYFGVALGPDEIDADEIADELEGTKEKSPSFVEEGSLMGGKE